MLKTPLKSQILSVFPMKCACPFTPRNPTDFQDFSRSANTLAGKRIRILIPINVDGNPGFWKSLEPSIKLWISWDPDLLLLNFRSMNVATPQKPHIWAPRLRNRLVKKRDTQKVAGSAYNHKNHDFILVFRVLWYVFTKWCKNLYSNVFHMAGSVALQIPQSKNINAGVYILRMVRSRESERRGFFAQDP